MNASGSSNDFNYKKTQISLKSHKVLVHLSLQLHVNVAIPFVQFASGSFVLQGLFIHLPFFHDPTQRSITVIMYFAT